MGVLGRSGRRWWGGMVQAEVTQIGQEPLWGGKRSGGSSGHRASWTWTTLSLPPPRPTASHAFLDFHRSLTAVIILTSFKNGQYRNPLLQNSFFHNACAHILVDKNDIFWCHKKHFNGFGHSLEFLFFKGLMRSSWTTSNICCVEYKQSDRQKGLS